MTVEFTVGDEIFDVVKDAMLTVVATIVDHDVVEKPTFRQHFFLRVLTEPRYKVVNHFRVTNTDRDNMIHVIHYNQKGEIRKELVIDLGKKRKK